MRCGRLPSISSISHRIFLATKKLKRQQHSVFRHRPQKYPDFRTRRDRALSPYRACFTVGALCKRARCSQALSPYRGCFTVGALCKRARCSQALSPYRAFFTVGALCKRARCSQAISNYSGIDRAPPYSSRSPDLDLVEIGSSQTTAAAS